MKRAAWQDLRLLGICVIVWSNICSVTLDFWRGWKLSEKNILDQSPTNVVVYNVVVVVMADIVVVGVVVAVAVVVVVIVDFAAAAVDTFLIGWERKKKLELERRGSEKRDHLKRDKLVALSSSDFEISNTYVTTYWLHLLKKILLRHPLESLPHPPLSKPEFVSCYDSWIARSFSPGTFICKEHFFKFNLHCEMNSRASLVLEINATSIIKLQIYM